METRITFIWISSKHFCFPGEDVGESNLVVPRAKISRNIQAAALT